jgi:hypothetical protein
MKRKFRNRGWLLCGLFLLSAVVWSQPEPVTRATAMVDSVARTGFYRIVLPPKLVAKCRADLSDLRIYKPDGSTVPYVLRTDMQDRLNAGYLALSDPAIRRKDSSNKHSYYRLQYDDSYRIDRLSLMVSGPILFKREVRIMAGSDSTDPIPVTSVSIDPHDTAFRLPSVKARTLVIDVDNGDNPPLVITRVASAQSGIYMLTYLEAISRIDYQLQTGHDENGPPDYDLHYFTDSLSQHPFDIGLQPIRLDNMPAPNGLTAGGRDKANRRSGLLLWGILSVILFLLLYMSVKLAKSIAQKKDQ